MSSVPRILYIEDKLEQNIPRLQRLFERFLSKSELKRLQELENSSDGYGVDPEKIKQLFVATQNIDVEFSFPLALDKIRKYGDEYALFIVDRNLSEVDYTVEEVENIDPQYSEKLHKRFHEREGDYILLKLTMNKKVDVLNKFYFLTAYSSEYEIKSSSELENLIDLGAFQQKNFIEKGNEGLLKYLFDVIKNLSAKSSSASALCIFDLNDGSTIRGTFVSSVVNIQTVNGKIPLNTSQIIEVALVSKIPTPEFLFQLKGNDSLKGRFLDKKIVLNTQVSPKHQIITNNILSIKVV